MQLISERIGQEIGKLPNRIDQAQDPAVVGIDFVEVAESHVLFFGRVKDFVHGELPESKADLAEFGQCCELEGWLKGSGASRYGQLRSFGRLHDAHAEFHRHAADVLAMIHAGSWIAAEHIRKSELSQALRRVLIALTELNESINKQVWNIS
jgi:Chemoreceptor zinc-binding domain